jgi:hypothetical protein
VPPCEHESERVRPQPIKKARLRGSNRLPQGGKPSFPFPRGLDRRCCRHWCGRRRTPGHLRGARPRLRDARCLSCRMSGGGRSRARPRRRLFHRLRDSGEGGEGSHYSGGARPPSLSSSASTSPDDEYTEVPGEEIPCCSRSRNSSLLRSRRSRCRMLRSFLGAARSCSHRCATRAHARARGVGGSDRATFTALICKEQARCRNTPISREPAEQGGRKSTYQWADREHGKRPEGCVIALGSPEVDGAPRPCGRVLPREEVWHQPRPRQRDGVRVLMHLEDAKRPLH